MKSEYTFKCLRINKPSIFIDVRIYQYLIYRLMYNPISNRYQDTSNYHQQCANSNSYAKYDYFVADHYS